MTRAEWLDYFETVNGRKPSVAEMAEALKNGEFINEVSADAKPASDTIKVETEVIESSGAPLVTENSVYVVTSDSPSQGLPSKKKKVDRKSVV